MNKYTYKLHIQSTKYIPIIIALCVIFDSFAYITNKVTYFNETLSGVSVLTLIPLYISARTFSLCVWHKLILYYITINMFIENYIKDLNLFNNNNLAIITLSIGVTLITLLYVNSKRNIEEITTQFVRSIRIRFM